MFGSALPTFIITLREGFEAALIVGIVLACLEKAGRSSLNPQVYRGIGAGIIASILVGLFLGGIISGVEKIDSQYVPMIKEFLAAIFGTIAVITLAYMLIWMTAQSRAMKSEVETAIKNALGESKNTGRAIFLLVFIAVLREGFETVLFILAGFQSGWQIQTAGAIAGLSTASLLGFLLFRGGLKINIRLFFQIMGGFLILIVGGLVIGVLKHIDAGVNLLDSINPFDSLCWYGGDSCLLGGLVWDGSEILSDRTFPGILLKSLFGYREKLYLLQAIAYGIFLTVIGGLYFFGLRERSVISSKSSIDPT